MFPGFLRLTELRLHQDVWTDNATLMVAASAIAIRATGIECINRCHVSRTANARSIFAASFAIGIVTSLSSTNGNLT